MFGGKLAVTVKVWENWSVVPGEGTVEESDGSEIH